MATIHHLNCGTLRPLLGGFLSGDASLARGHMVCHCWLIETAKDGLILIDTGMPAPTGAPRRAVDRLQHALLGVADDAGESAASQVAARGFALRDVRHIVLTHMDLDHAGGLVDFPWATVHVHASELAAANTRDTLFARQRYQPTQWQQHQHWATYEAFGDRWLGLPAVQRLRGVHAEVALVPLVGHTRGHSGVAAQAQAGWRLHAGDAIFHCGELGQGAPAPRGIDAITRVLETNRAARLASVGVLRDLAAQGVHINSAHDPAQLPMGAASATSAPAVDRAP